MKNAAKTLERDHFGLKKAKERILEYIAVRSLKTEERTAAAFFVLWDPGVGKLHSGVPLQILLGRKFVRVSGRSAR